jgi:hypothetical protein
MKKLVVLVVIVGILGGCALKKPLVGRTVSYRSPLIDRIFSLPDNGLINSPPFKIYYEVDKTEETEYKVWGTIEYYGPGVFTKIHSGHFRLLIVKDGVVIDSFLFSPKRKSMEKPMKFEIKFSSPVEFDGIGFVWSLVVRE